MKEIPVYLFTGFIEAGKTRFIQETLEDPKFNSGEKTLLLLCEEGVEEYDASRFAGSEVYVRTVMSPDQMTPERLKQFADEANADRVVAEYNGMWLLNDFYASMPEGWLVYQEVMFADSTTFETYNSNMRSLVVDKLQSCEMVVFNRACDNTDFEALHKIVRAISRRADIAYEFCDGSVKYDDIEDPLPFDIDADIIDIKPEHYAEWYRDLSEDMEKYNGKTVKFLGIAVFDKEIPSDSFIIGRKVMTCCIDDTKFAGLVCVNTKNAKIKDRSWITLTARLEVKPHKVYGQKGPVLTLISHQDSEKPEQEIATFY